MLVGIYTTVLVIKTTSQSCNESWDESLVMSHLLQTENESLGTENLVRLSGFTQSLLDDVAIIVIILKKERKTVTTCKTTRFIAVQQQ